MTGRLVSPDNLGAWLIKCNADVTGIAGMVRRGEPVGKWCVQPSYRTALMRRGQRVIFWVSGSRRRRPGIWGLGWLAGGAVADPDADRPRLRVPLDVVFLADADRVDRDALGADARLCDLEVLRMPQASNPSFVSAAHLSIIEEYVTWPAR
jgi:hypothetical protein